MIENFSGLLKKVIGGDEPSWEKLKQYFKDHVLTEAEQEQVHLYFKKFNHQYSHAIYLRAFLYDYGYGVPVDLEMAFLLMREAAAAGHSAATFEVGRRFFYGLGIEKNQVNALQWITIAAESPHYYPAAMYHLGLIYEKGIGISKDQALADHWFQKAKMKGYQFKND